MDKINGSSGLRYSAEELKEFEEIIVAKIEDAKAELNHLRESIMRIDETSKGTSFEDGADVHEKEYLTQLASRTQKFIGDLERALFRIKNGTYGICIDTGELIPKERLRAVPHTQQTIEAKLNRSK